MRAKQSYAKYNLAHTGKNKKWTAGDFVKIKAFFEIMLLLGHMNLVCTNINIGKRKNHSKGRYIPQQWVKTDSGIY